MGKANQHSAEKACRKWPWIVLVCFFGVMGLVRVSLTGGPVHHWMKNKIIATANNQLRPTLTIEKLSGDLWSGATLINVQLDDGDRVASIDTVHLEYDILSYFGDVFQIREVRLVQPFIKLHQQPDSTWNVQNWTTPVRDTTQSTFAFSLSNLITERGHIDVKTVQLPQDSSFTVADLNLASSLAYYGDRYHVSIDDLNFKVRETNLDAPLSVSTAADADEESISLEQLVIATGHSMLRASGRIHLADNTARLEAETTPLGWEDIVAYAKSVPVKTDIRTSFNLSGNYRDFTGALVVNADGIEELSVTSNFKITPEFTVTALRATAARLDLETFLGDTSMPRLRNLTLKAQGDFPVFNYRKSHLSGMLSAVNIRQRSYKLDALEGTFTLENAKAEIRLEPVNDAEKIITQAYISNIWDESPSLTIRARGRGITLSHWLNTPSVTGRFSFRGEVSGQGWIPAQDYWNYRLDVNQSTLMDQRVDRATLRGRFNQNNLTNDSKIQIGKGTIALWAEAHQLQETPAFNWRIDLQEVDLSALKGMNEYPSSLTGTLRGSGRGTTLDNLQLQATAAVDSSIFKAELIDRLALVASLADSTLDIEQGQLTSSIADAAFSGEFRIGDMYARENSLDVDVTLKDISSLASVMNVDILQATGTIEGELKPTARDSLIFDGALNLKNINYDQQFLARKITGGVRVQLAEEPAYLLDINIMRPSISSVEMQNIKIRTNGRFREYGADGSFELKFFGERQGSITQQGTYHITDDTSAVELTSLNLTSSLRTLSLTQPFHAQFASGALQTDTLRVSSSDGAAFIHLAVPYADSLHQKAYLKGKNLNLAVIQQAALHNVYLQGKLFGEMSMDRTDTSLTASGDIILSDLVYRETALDTLLLRANIVNERLKGRLELHQKGALIAEGALNVPFEAKNPGKLDESFFERPVSGYLRMYKLSLERFSGLLTQMGYERTKGTVQFDGTLEGRAGNPAFQARLRLTNAQLSGVPVDSLIAAVNYQHDASKLNVNAALTSLKQEALEIDARIPLYVDLRSFDVALARPQDSIRVGIKTNDFNLKALNDFVDRKELRNLEGRINGDVQIRGPRSDLQASGEFTLRRGAVRVVPANIRLHHIESTIHFHPDRIVLSNLHMESGKGQLDASGELAMKHLVPGNLNLIVKARNFKAANTDEYNGLVNMDMKVGGSISQPHITGNMELINGFVKLDNFGEKSVETVQLDTTRPMEPEISLYDSLTLDMSLEFNRRFYVRNERYLEMEIELDGELDIIKKQGKELQLFGTLRTPDGYAKPLGKRFELVDGSLAFAGPPANPQINVRTLYEPPQAEQEIKIWYVIEGTVEDPQFRYESQPQMNLAGIMSYTLFGQPYYKLNSAEQSVASTSSNNAAADLAIDVLLDRVEAIATKRLGIDMVRIENTRVGGESGTAITTGWYVNPKVFFAIQNIITGSTPTTGFYLEYYLRENLKLILSQGNDNRQGVDLQWEYDY